MLFLLVRPPRAPVVSGMAEPAYDAVAAGLHWLTALLIVVTVPLGAVLDSLPRVDTTYAYYNAHKWIGVTLFSLVVARALWRWRHPAPPLPPTLGAWQQRLAIASHRMLYLLLLAVPLVGWLGSEAGGHPIVWFNVLPLPAPVPADAGLSEVLHKLHAVLAWSLVTLAALHVLAALKHLLVDRDRVFSRMTRL